MININSRLILILSILLMASSCGLFESESPSEEEQVDENSMDETEEIEIPDLTEEEKQEIEVQKKEQKAAITKELSKSSFKNMSDDEIKSYLEEELSKFSAQCDTAIYGKVLRQMRSDMRMQKFRKDNYSFSQEFGQQLVQTKNACEK